MGADLKAVTRRIFTGGAALASAAGFLHAKKDDRSITRASVPGDPDAPKEQDGTVPESLPFDKPLEFKRRDLALKAEPFPMTDVRLLAGPFYEMQEANRQMLLRLPVDRLMHTFRLNAGLPSQAEPLGGWERPDCELRGHFAGHYLSACALMYAATGDEKVKAQGDALVTGLAQCQQKIGTGYLSAFPVEFIDRVTARKKVWAPFYTIHKVMAGLFDMHRLCGNEQALTVLKGMADWTGQWSSELSNEQMQMVLDTEYGGMNDVLYNLSAVTEEPRYAQIGDRFTKQRFFNPLALRRDELRGLHANTHIPQVIGAARRYELSGDQRFHDVADFFWQQVVETRTYATGGTSNNEGWLVDPNALAQELSLGKDTNECCCAYNMMKLTRMLYTWTADPRYFDYYERTLYNHRLGTMEPKSGVTQYYLGIVPGSWRTFGSEYNSFWCCNGTGVEEYAKLNDSIYFHAGDSLYVNLYVPSELNWKQKGIHVRQTNQFPESPVTEFSIKAEQPSRFALCLRVPDWVSEFPTVMVNGVATEVSGAPGSYLTVLRTWKNGDRVRLKLPMSLHAEGMPDDPSMQAIFYGPLVLAGYTDGQQIEENQIANKMGPDLKKVSPTETPSFHPAQKSLVEWIKPGKKPLSFEANAGEVKKTLLPFNEVEGGRRYSVYWRIS